MKWYHSKKKKRIWNGRKQIVLQKLQEEQSEEQLKMEKLLNICTWDQRNRIESFLSRTIHCSSNFPQSVIKFYIETTIKDWSLLRMNWNFLDISLQLLAKLIAPHE